MGNALRLSHPVENEEMAKKVLEKYSADYKKVNKVSLIVMIVFEIIVALYTVFCTDVRGRMFLFLTISAFVVIPIGLIMLVNSRKKNKIKDIKGINSPLLCIESKRCALQSMEVKGREITDFKMVLQCLDIGLDIELSFRDFAEFEKNHYSKANIYFYEEMIGDYIFVVEGMQ